MRILPKSFDRALFQLSFYPWLACFIGAIFYCYEYYLRVSPSDMVEGLMHLYKLNAAQFSNMTQFYYYAYMPMQLLVGILMDRYGPRRLLTMACACCAAGAFLFSTGHNVLFADAGRFLIGFGSAFAFVGVLKLATIWLPPERFGMISGATTALGMLGAVIGDISLTKLVHLIGWRSTMHIAAGAGVLLTFFIWLIVRDRYRVKRKRKTIKASSPEFLDFSKLISALWTSVKKPQLWLVGLMGCLLYLPVTAFAELWARPYLHYARGCTAAESAALTSMIFVGWMVGGPFAGLISDFLKRRRLPVMFGALVSSVFILIVLYVPNNNIIWLGAMLFCFGFFNAVQVLVFALGREIANKKISGTAIAFINAFVMLSGLSPLLIGKLLDVGSHGSVHDSAAFSVMDYRLALTVIPVSLVLAFVLSFFMKETHCRLTSD